MTLFELLAFVFPSLGILCGIGYGLSREGTPVIEVVIAGELGLLAGGAVYVLFMLSLCGLILFLEWWRPSRPPCRRGRCGPHDYTHLSWEGPAVSEADSRLARRVLEEGHGLLLRCRCGDLYAESAKDRRVLELTPEGGVRPYRSHAPLGRRWLPDPRGAP